MRHYVYHCIIALDQLLNAMLGGYADETLSSRAYRLSRVKRRWRVVCRMIDGMFWWQAGHCKKAYEMEVQRRHFPV